MKIICAAVVLMVSTLASWGQSWDMVRNSSLYIYGEGTGNTIEEADRAALADLVSKISVNVTSSLTTTDRENATNRGIESESQTQAMMRTYSNVQVPNARKVIIHDEPGAIVGRWIYADEKEKIFDDRKAKILDLVAGAETAAEKGQIDEALRRYYWSFLLTNSLPRPSDMKLNDESGRQRLLTSLIPERMKDICKAMKAEVVSRNGETAELEFTYQGKPVTSVDYRVYEGDGYGSINSAKDGTGIIEDLGANKKVKIKYEYEYKGQAGLDADVESVIEVSNSMPLPDAYAELKMKKAAAPKPSPVAMPQAQEGTLVAAKPVKVPEIKLSTNETAAIARQTVTRGLDRPKQIVEAIARDIQSKNYNPPAQYFTEHGLEIYNKLIKYGRARIVGQPELIVAQDGDNLMVRGMKMSFSFPKGARRTFVEDITFTFNADDQVENLAFGLDEKARTTVYSRTAWKPGSKEAVLNFLENYKTAFALKRLDYISDIFADDAIIITGSVTRRSTRKFGDGGIMFGGEQVRYTRYTKSQYLKKLARTFAANEYVNIRFSNNEIKKMAKGGETFAIQVEQDYYSTHYNDHGYLLLLVDINDPDEPTIKIRTWQPQKDPKFGLFTPEDF